MRDRVALAKQLAEKLHEGQTRKDGSPQFDHCQRVATRLAPSTEDREGRMIVAYLHDVLEDTGFDGLCLRLLFGEDVLTDVETLTRADGEPYLQFIERATKGSDRALLVKLADLADNLTPSESSEAMSLRARYIKAQAILLRECANRGILQRPDLEPA